MTAPDLHPAIDAVWRMESARIVAALVRIVRDIGLAEDMAHDALIAALEHPVLSREGRTALTLKLLCGLTTPEIARAFLVPETPVVALNRPVAVAMADGPAAGLALVDALADTPALRDYHLLPAVRADLLLRLGQREQARGEFERAAALTGNTRERDLLLGRAREATSP